MKKIKLLALNGLIVGTTILAPITVLTSCKKEEKKKPAYIDYVQTNVYIVDKEKSGVINFKLGDLKSTDLTVSNMKMESCSSGIFKVELESISKSDEQNGFIAFNLDMTEALTQDEWAKISFDISGKSDENEWTYHVDSVTINRIISVVYVGSNKEISTNPGLTYAQFSFKFGKNKIPQSLDEVQINPTVTSSSDISVSYDISHSTLNKSTGEALIAFNLENLIEKYLTADDSAEFSVQFRSEDLDFNTTITDFKLTYTSGINDHDTDASTEPGSLSAEYKFTFKQDFQNPTIEAGFVGDRPEALSSKINYRFDETQHNVIYFIVSAESEEKIEPELDKKLSFNLSIKITDSKTTEVLLLEKINGLSFTYASKIRCQDEDKKGYADSLVGSGSKTESVPFAFELINDQFQTGDVLSIKVFTIQTSDEIVVEADPIVTPTSGSDVNILFFLQMRNAGSFETGDYGTFKIEITLTRNDIELWTQKIDGFSLYYLPKP